jgi:dolichol-phosphate mannosyltransferase
MNNKNLIVIPTYNEENNIGPLIKEIINILPETDIIIIDDNSTDNTQREVEELIDIYKEKITLKVRKNERGLGTAYSTGLLYGLEKEYYTVMTMDADHSHSPQYLPTIIKKIEKFDVVIGSRYIKDGGTVNWRIRRILLSWLANRFARFLLGLTGTDLTSGFRAYKADILKKIDFNNIHSNGYSYLVEMLYLIKLLKGKIAEIPIIFHDRTLGKSKISKKEIYRGALTLLRLKFSKRKLKIKIKGE